MQDSAWTGSLENKWGQLSFGYFLASPKSDAVSTAGEVTQQPVFRPKRKRASVYCGKFDTRCGDDYRIEEIRRPGCHYVSIELIHSASGYRDRIVLLDMKESKPRIEAAKKQLVTRFKVEKSLGTHLEQKYYRGGSEISPDDL